MVAAPSSGGFAEIHRILRRDFSGHESKNPLFSQAIYLAIFRWFQPDFGIRAEAGP
jgi:hypothetical protein